MNLQITKDFGYLLLCGEPLRVLPVDWAQWAVLLQVLLRETHVAAIIRCLVLDSSAGWTWMLA